MKLVTALSIANDCGLETLGEAICNIEMHSISIFDYDKINQEEKELKDEAEAMVQQHGFTMETSISVVLDKIADHAEE